MKTKLPPKAVPCVKDENGQFWTLIEGKLRIVGDDSPNGGYCCKNIDEGITLLRKIGYLSWNNRIEP